MHGTVHLSLTLVISIYLLNVLSLSRIIKGMQKWKTWIVGTSLSSSPVLLAHLLFWQRWRDHHSDLQNQFLLGTREQSRASSLFSLSLSLSLSLSFLGYVDPEISLLIPTTYRKVFIKFGQFFRLSLLYIRDVFYLGFWDRQNCSNS